MKKEDLRRENLTPFPEILSRISLENPEKSLLIIDIDGVLINTTPKIFLKGLFLYLFSKRNFDEFIKNKKIPLEYLLKIKRIVESGVEVVLFTSRVKSKDKNFFPFLSEEIVKRFKENNILLILFPKILFKKLPQELLRKIEEKERIFYIGSGKLDELVFNELKKKYKEKNLEYFSAGGSRKLI